MLTVAQVWVKEVGVQASALKEPKIYSPKRLPSLFLTGDW